MRVNARPSRARFVTPAWVLGLFVAFVGYANGAAFIAHQATAHGHDAATAHAACSGSHGHTDTPPASDTPDAPTPGSDAPCTLCDMLLATGTQATLVPVASPPTVDAGVVMLTHGSLTCGRQPQPSISRRGPPSCA